MEGVLAFIVLGAIQGMTEWLPISSEGLIVLIANAFFPGDEGIIDLIRIAVFLHLGTFFAALFYFRKDVAKLLEALVRYKEAGEETRKLLVFLLMATLASGLVGGAVLLAISGIGAELFLAGSILMALIGGLLVISGLLQLKVRDNGRKGVKELDKREGIIQGIIQGFSVLPGLSRSGTTVSAFLLRGFDKTVALKVSFLMSLPVVLLGNIVLNIGQASFSYEALYGLLSAFLFGMLTIHALMKLSQRINFGWFAIILGLIAIAFGVMLA